MDPLILLALSVLVALFVIVGRIARSSNDRDPSIGSGAENSSQTALTSASSLESDAPSQVETYEVWRQDDSGNKFLVEIFTTEQDAQQLVDTLTARGHKQFYWWEKRPNSRT